MLLPVHRAVQHIELIRSDIPITYQDGQSSFRVTLEPLYQELTDLLLLASETSDKNVEQRSLREAQRTIELVKQSELEDYLQDRCSVGTNRTSATATVPSKTAIYYPIVLADRLELLVETSSGIYRHKVDVAAERRTMMPPSKL